MLTLSTIKRETGEYDTEVVQRLVLPYAGLTQLSNLESCFKLIELALPNNKIMRMECLGTLHTLQRLDLSHNKVLRIENLEGLHSLLHLDLRGNAISHVENLKGLDSHAALISSEPCPVAGGASSSLTMTSSKAASARADSGRGLSCPKLTTLYLRSPDGTAANPVCESCSGGPGAGGGGGGGGGNGEESYSAAVDRWCSSRPDLKFVDGESLTLRAMLNKAGLTSAGQGSRPGEIILNADPKFTTPLSTENWLAIANREDFDFDDECPGNPPRSPIATNSAAASSASKSSAGEFPPPVAPVGADIAAGEAKMLLREITHLTSESEIVIAEARQAAGLQ